MTKQEIIEKVNYILKGTYNQVGIEKWWNRPRKQLGNLSPKQMVKLNPELVLELARGINI